MTDRLEDTVALVTGASSGIGEATARALAGQGATVAIAARRRDRLEKLAEEIEQGGGRALAIETDVKDHLREEVREQALKRFAEIEMLQADDIADAISYIVTRPRHVAVNELLIRPTEQTG